VSLVASPPHHPSPSRPPVMSTGKLECHLDHSPTVSYPCHHAGPPWTGPRPWSMERGPSPPTFAFRNKSGKPKFNISWHFCKETLSFCKKARGIWNFKTPYVFNHNSKFGGSCAKIHKITPSFFLCIHIKHVCCILLIDCLWLLHVRKQYAKAVLRGFSRPCF
jgi:hypothetical protein